MPYAAQNTRQAKKRRVFFLLYCGLTGSGLALHGPLSWEAPDAVSESMLRMVLLLELHLGDPGRPPATEDAAACEGSSLPT